MLTKMLTKKVWNLRAHLSCEHWLRDDADYLRGLLLALLRYNAYATYRCRIRCACAVLRGLLLALLRYNAYAVPEEREEEAAIRTLRIAASYAAYAVRPPPRAPQTVPPRRTHV
jgi:hypothetical protein